jgi:DedD protein
MKISGSDFIKNLEIEKEKAKLKEQTEFLNNKISNSISSTTNTIQDEKLIQEENMTEELDDIILDKEKNNKQKYIVLAFALLLLFVITIIIIRLLSEPVNSNSFSDEIITEREIIEVKNKNLEKKIDANKELDINIIQANEDNIKQLINKDSQQEAKKEDIFNINLEENNNTPKIEKINSKKILPIEKEPIIKEDIQVATTIKPRIKPSKQALKNNTKIKQTNKPKGFYVQVGAFTKQVNNSLIKNLNQSKLEYISYKMTVNNRLYTKILVGPYKNRTEATKDLNTIQQQTKKLGAFIMEFK